MKKIAFILGTISIAGLSSCCGCSGHGDGNDHDSTAVHETSHEEHEEGAAIAFDGVDRGDYTLYGHTDINAADAATVSEMLTEMDETGAFNRKVAVNISEVCQKAGCWITFDTEEGENIRVFFRDHFTIPIETATGTEAILYGSLVVDTLSVDFQKHLLDDAKEAGHEVAQEEYDAITGDKIERTFDCESILVKKSSH